MFASGGLTQENVEAMPLHSCNKARCGEHIQIQFLDRQNGRSIMHGANQCGNFGHATPIDVESAKPSHGAAASPPMSRQAEAKVARRSAGGMPWSNLDLVVLEALLPGANGRGRSRATSVLAPVSESPEAPECTAYIGSQCKVVGSACHARS